MADLGESAFFIFRKGFSMKRMEEKILTEGKVLPGGILKVGSFLNQRIDTSFLGEIGEEIEWLYGEEGVTKILTIESSGIAMAVAAGMAMKVPVVFVKKHKTSNVDGEAYYSKVHSFTHNEDYNIMVSKDYIKEDDRILIVDDFLASGHALRGLVDICRQAGATIVGAAVAIEKCFQEGGDKMRKEGLRIEALAAIESMSDEEIVFRQS